MDRKPFNTGLYLPKLMNRDLITKMLETGTCPVCGGEIEMDDQKLTIYKCTSDPTHFTLEVDFGEDGNTISAKLNGENVSQSDLETIAW